MKTYKSKIITSFVALAAVVGGTFTYIASAKGGATNAAMIDSSNSQVATLPTQSSASVTTATPAASVRSATMMGGDDEGSEGGEGGEGGEDGGSAPAASAIATAPADVPPSTRMMGGSGMMNKYKDGTYSVTGNYESPDGYETIGVTLTLKGGVVTAADVVNQAVGGRSARYQDMFIGGYKPYVIGKNIDSISLSYVSGSSLTPIGFNDAVAKIKAKAQA